MHSNCWLWYAPLREIVVFRIYKRLLHIIKCLLFFPLYAVGTFLLTYRLTVRWRRFYFVYLLPIFYRLLTVWYLLIVAFPFHKLCKWAEFKLILFVPFMLWKLSFAQPAFMKNQRINWGQVKLREFIKLEIFLLRKGLC